MQSWVGKIAIICFCAASLAGCGGGSSKPNNTVTQVAVGPASLSLVPGEVAQLSASALNSASTPVLSTITYSSSNPSQVTVSTGGLVCAGVWDANFVVCNKGTTGTANITATASGVNSTPVPVAVHPPVASIVVQQTAPTTTCTTVKLTQQYEAHAFASGGAEITNQVGPFTWSTTTSLVGTVDTNGLVTAVAPGAMGVLARIGNVSSPAAGFRGCMPVSILLHLSSDAAGSPTTSATLNTTQTLALEADMVDEAGVATSFAPVTLSSNNSAVASISSGTLTAQTPGGAGILAACIPPGCGANLNLPVYSNLFSVTVNGTSPATTVYASTTFAPPSGSFSTVVPIDTTNNTAGTAINLPGPPNSIVFTPNGSKAFIGTTAGLASLDTGTNTATLVTPVPGKVLAVSPDGNTVIISNAASSPDVVTGAIGPIEPNPAKQRLTIVVVNNGTVQILALPAAAAAAFTNDGFKAFISTNDGSGNVYVYSPFISLQTINVPGVSSNNVSTLTSGPFAYLVSGSNLQTLSTCSNATVSPAPGATTAPQLAGSFANNNIVVAVNSTGLDLNTATVASPLTSPIDTTHCTPGVSYSPSFIDFGQGAFTARQLLVAGDSVGNNSDPTNGTHMVVLPVGMNKLLTAVPGGGTTIINLPAGATEALSGGLTQDGNTAWVGVAGNNSVDKIDLVAGTDTNQVATSFKKSDSTPAPPNLVGVKPK